jgi:hypothetical protein
MLSTHHMDEADLLSDRIGIIAAGKLQCFGSSFPVVRPWPLPVTARCTSLYALRHCLLYGYSTEDDTFRQFDCLCTVSHAAVSRRHPHPIAHSVGAQ